MSALPSELLVFAWSIGLFVVHMAAQGGTATREQGLAWNAGPRDQSKPLGVLAGRAHRAFANFRETYPVFIGLALALAVSGRAGGLGATGAWLWLAARVVFLPLYLLGVPWLRTATFGVSMAGLALMLARLVAGHPA